MFIGFHSFIDSSSEGETLYCKKRQNIYTYIDKVNMNMVNIVMHFKSMHIMYLRDILYCLIGNIMPS